MTSKFVSACFSCIIRVAIGINVQNPANRRHRLAPRAWSKGRCVTSQLGNLQNVFRFEPMFSTQIQVTTGTRNSPKKTTKSVWSSFKATTPFARTHARTRLRVESRAMVRKGCGKRKRYRQTFKHHCPWQTVRKNHHVTTCTPWGTRSHGEFNS